MGVEATTSPLAGPLPGRAGALSRRGRRGPRPAPSAPVTASASVAAGGLTISDVTVRPLDVRLFAPFNIASAEVSHVHNVGIRLTLSDGSIGWGESPTLFPVTAEDQPTALAAVRYGANWLRGRPVTPAWPRGWKHVTRELEEVLPGHAYAASRCGLEMALIDALARHGGQPLWRLFGGAGKQVTTDITIPICPPAEAEALAAAYRSRGFCAIKIKIGGGTLEEDAGRVAAIRRGHPSCDLLLDANEGLSVASATTLLDTLCAAGLKPALLEQPTPRADWQGLGAVTAAAAARGVRVAADESVRSPEDARRVAEGGLAHVINLKLAKSGVAGALDIAAIARGAGLGLMVGGMVETRLAMGFAAQMAAGLGGVDYIDLDTPLLLAEETVQGGYVTDGGPLYELGDAPGNAGAALRWGG